MDRPPEVDDIQGNVLVGFNTDVQEIVALTSSSDDDAAAWLASLADSVAVASEVHQSRAAMKASRSPTTWLCVAVGQRFLNAVAPDVVIRDLAFQRGMIRRAPSILSDATDAKEWIVGSPDEPVDVLLIVAANDEAAVRRRADELCDAASRVGLSTSYRETARRNGGREHFGFLDGISQPKVIGVDADGDLGPGHFVFGYPKAPGEEPFAPVMDGRGVTDNGSLLVFRRLVQDVEAFHTFCRERSKEIQVQWPDISPGHVAALLVGRWPSGAPVRAGETQDPGTNPPANDFDFHDDSEGRSCPFGAHIRKVNPRAGRADLVDVPRMMRRGIPFGRPFDESPKETNRGLAFLAFQTSIRDQFEFLSQQWMNSADLPGPGHDLLVGRSDDPRQMHVAGPSGPVAISGPEKPWIMPTGGAYLFAPGRSGLKKFATRPARMGLWRVRKMWTMTADSVRAQFE